MAKKDVKSEKVKAKAKTAKAKTKEVEGDTEAEYVPKSSLASIQPIGKDQIGAPEIAEMLGIAPRDFRNWLRTHKRDMTGEAKGTRYAWQRDSDEVEELIEEFKASLAEKPEKPKKAKKSKKAKEEEIEEEVIDTDLEEDDDEDDDEIEDIDLDLDI